MRHNTKLNLSVFYAIIRNPSEEADVGVVSIIINKQVSTLNYGMICSS